MGVELSAAGGGEICKLQAADIGKHDLIVHAGNTKTLRTRTVPIVPALRPWLEFIPLAISAEGIKTGWRRAREAAGMEEVNFHDLRHSCASILIASGADLFTVSKILGHSSVKTTERYAHMQIEQQRSAMLNHVHALTARTVEHQAAVFDVAQYFRDLSHH